jgi:RimJ/RimL family protein N-acetyltransferase
VTVTPASAHEGEETGGQTARLAASMIEMVTGIGTATGRRLAIASYAPGDVIWAAGEPASTFGLVLKGQAAIVDDRGVAVGEVSPGSILGELSLLKGHVRRHTVTAITALDVGFGDRFFFEALLSEPSMGARIGEIASARLAEAVRPTPVTLQDGARLNLRPLLPTDREAYLEAVANASPETLMNRFFTGGPPAPATVDYLLAVDYFRHFAWVAIEADSETTGVGITHYFVADREPTTAEVAFAIADDYQGRGLGTILLGAIAVAAQAVGVTRLYASVLPDNHAMRSVLNRAQPEWSSEPGAAVARFLSADARATIDPGLAETLSARVADLTAVAWRTLM